MRTTRKYYNSNDRRRTRDRQVGEQCVICIIRHARTYYYNTIPIRVTDDQINDFDPNDFWSKTMNGGGRARSKGTNEILISPQAFIAEICVSTEYVII